MVVSTEMYAIDGDDVHKGFPVIARDSGGHQLLKFVRFNKVPCWYINEFSAPEYPECWNR
jgi:hypothetical protein